MTWITVHVILGNLGQYISIQGKYIENYGKINYTIVININKVALKNEKNKNWKK